MKKNMGIMDRALRIVTALIIIILFLTDNLSGLAAAILLSLSAVFILTSFVSFCPLYYMLKIRTNKSEDEQTIMEKR